MMSFALFKEAALRPAVVSAASKPLHYYSPRQILQKRKSHDEAEQVQKCLKLKSAIKNAMESTYQSGQRGQRSIPCVNSDCRCMKEVSYELKRFGWSVLPPRGRFVDSIGLDPESGEAYFNFTLAGRFKAFKDYNESCYSLDRQGELITQKEFKAMESYRHKQD